MRTVTLKYDAKKVQYYFLDEISGREAERHYPPAYGKLYVIRQAALFALANLADQLIDGTVAPHKILILREAEQNV